MSERRRTGTLLAAGLAIGAMWAVNDFRPDPYHLLRLAVVLFVVLPTVVHLRSRRARRAGRPAGHLLPLRWLMLGKLGLIAVALALTALLSGVVAYPYTVTGALLVPLTVAAGRWALGRADS